MNVNWSSLLHYVFIIWNNQFQMMLIHTDVMFLFISTGMTNCYSLEIGLLLETPHLNTRKHIQVVDIEIKIDLKLIYVIN